LEALRKIGRIGYALEVKPTAIPKLCKDERDGAISGKEILALLPSALGSTFGGYRDD
jgi:hypothetical protein